MTIGRASSSTTVGCSFAPVHETGCARAGKELGYETITINCNPETVSTDFDTADKLYFEPVFWEHIYDIIQHEQPEGVIVQLGGQTALKLAEKLEKYGIKIIGTSFAALDMAEDRERSSHRSCASSAFRTPNSER